MFHVHLTSSPPKNETLISFAKLTIDPGDKVLRFSWTGNCRKSGWKWNSSWIVSLLSFERDNSLLPSVPGFYVPSHSKTLWTPGDVWISTPSPSALENSQQQQHALIKSFASSWTWWGGAGLSVCWRQAATVSVHQSSLAQWFSALTIPPHNTEYPRASPRSSWVPLLCVNKAAVVCSTIDYVVPKPFMKSC